MANTITQKYVDGLVSKAISSDLDNEKTVKQAVVYCFKLAASEIGRFEELNKLFNGVSNGTKESIRQFAINLVRHTGISVTDENGKAKKVQFFKFSNKDGFAHPKEKTEHTKAHRKVIDEMEIENLMALTLGREKAEDIRRDMEFGLDDFEDRISRAIAWGLKNNVINTAIANQFNGLISATKRVDPDALAKEETRKRNDLIDRAKRMGLTVVEANVTETKAEKPNDAKAA